MKTSMSGQGPRFALAVLLMLCGLLMPVLAAADGRGTGIRAGLGRTDVVGAGYFHSCALRGDGGVACWGAGNEGRTSPPSGSFVQISISGHHGCGLRGDGNLSCWGRNTSFQATAPAGAFVQVDSGDVHSCGVRADGSAACWGGNTHGQTNVPAGSIVQVSAGFTHSCGVTAAGSAVCWGDNRYGQLNAPAGNFVQVSAGGFATCGVTAAGSAVCWGDATNGRTAPPAGSYAQVSLGLDHACGLRSDGSAVCWGKNLSGESNAPAGSFVQVSAGYEQSCGQRSDGSLACWGSNAQGQATAPAGTFGFGAINAGIFHSCGLRGDGSAACWGQNATGESSAPAGAFAQIDAAYQYSCGLRSDGSLGCWGSGNGAYGQASPPAGSFSQFSAGLRHGCAVRSDGALACWGVNFDGQASPPAGSFVQTSAGYLGSCGLRADGSVTCWGYAGYGQNAVPAGSYVQLSSGFIHNCGLRSNGAVACWGNNDNGQLDAPTGSFRQISADQSFTCGVRSSGTLACWGQVPFTPPPTGTFVQVSAGYEHACAIRDDGVRLCWGDNGSGQAPTLRLNYATLPNGRTGQAYSATLGVSANLYTAPTPGFAVSAGSLPPGLTLSAAGVLAGTPTAGGTFGFTIEGEDANGFVASRAYSVTIVSDTTAPVIVPTVTGTLGANGWYTGDVSISWSVTDGESPVSSTTGCNAVVLNTDALGAGFTCTATSAGGISSETVTVKRDATAPTLSAAAATAPNAAGWYRADVAVGFTCSDALSGVVACPATQTLVGEGAAVASTAQTVTDAAGNVSAASNVVTVRIDRAAPSLAPSVTPGTIVLNGTGTASANATDGLSGVAAESCAALDSASVGSKTVACSATDLAGNSANASTGYQVVYAFEGFEGLVAPARWNHVFTARSIPFTWRVRDANGAGAAMPASVRITMTRMTCPADVMRSSVFMRRYGGYDETVRSLGAGRFSRNWRIPSKAAVGGTCQQLTVDVGDGSSHSVLVRFN